MPNCKHRYVFPLPDGETVTGVCKYCGAEQVCPTTTPTYGTRRNSAAVQSKKFGRGLDRSLSRGG